MRLGFTWPTMKGPTGLFKIARITRFLTRRILWKIMVNEHEVGSATRIEIRQHMSTSFTLIVIAGYHPTVPNVVCTLAFAKKKRVCMCSLGHHCLGLI
jgi:hypothetical protein